LNASARRSPTHHDWDMACALQAQTRSALREGEPDEDGFITVVAKKKKRFAQIT